MDVATSVCSYPMQGDEDIQGCTFTILEKLSCKLIVQTHLLYLLFIRSFYVVIFNVSNTKVTHMLDFLDTSSMGVTVVRIDALGLLYVLRFLVRIHGS
jgi:hypothetical protein